MKYILSVLAIAGSLFTTAAIAKNPKAPLPLPDSIKVAVAAAKPLAAKPVSKTKAKKPSSKVAAKSTASKSAAKVKAVTPKNSTKKNSNAPKGSVKSAKSKTSTKSSKPKTSKTPAKKPAKKKGAVKKTKTAAPADQPQPTGLNQVSLVAPENSELLQSVPDVSDQSSPNSQTPISQTMNLCGQTSSS